MLRVFAISTTTGTTLKVFLDLLDWRTDKVYLGKLAMRVIISTCVRRNRVGVCQLGFASGCNWHLSQRLGPRYDVGLVTTHRANCGA